MKAFSQGKSMSFIRESKCGPPNEDKVFFRVCCGKKSDFVEKGLVSNQSLFVFFLINAYYYLF